MAADKEPSLKELRKAKRRIENRVVETLVSFQEEYGVRISGVEFDSELNGAMCTRPMHFRLIVDLGEES